MKQSKLPIIWLETNCSCDNNISFMNATYPYFDRVFADLIELLYSNTFMAAQGKDAVKILKVAAQQGQFTLVVEGAIPLKEEYNVVFTTAKGKVSALEAVKWLGGLAKYVVALGTCASFGGATTAKPNLSQSAAVSEVLEREVINVSGCPVNS
ncbi:MAG: Ni/Fe hydrogenase, partial [Halanaerobacter sp.]